MIHNSPTLHVRRISTEDELQSLASEWERLPFRSFFERPLWLIHWWNSFSAPSDDLYTLTVRDDSGVLRGLLPGFRRCSLTGGKVLRWLGGGKVCTDYQSMILQPDYRDAVLDALQQWLIDATDHPAHAWDEIEIESARADDDRIRDFARRMKSRGVHLLNKPAASAWQLTLPDSWDAYLASLKGHVRQRLNRLQRRYVHNGRAELRTADDAEQVGAWYQQMVDLHQRRWRDVGVDGCFSTPGFDDFLRHAIAAAQAERRVRLSALWVDGECAGISLFLKEGDAQLMYQCGMNPARRADQPGWLMNSLKLQEMIREGDRACDYLRGDERYKRELGAVAVPQQTWRIAAPRSSSMMRHRLWMTKDYLRSWGKQVAGAMRHETQK